jgi:hypothetical protein
MGLSPTRPSVHQIKIRDVNFYPGRGTITIDPSILHPYKGWDALFALLSEKYPPSMILYMKTLEV